MNQWKTIAEIRREYGGLNLTREESADNPYTQFDVWFNQVLQSEHSDPTAMALATVDEAGIPDVRIVLLKGIEQGCFLFYTHYDSAKGRHLENNPAAALNFYWPHMARQIRIRGSVHPISGKRSDEYFASRPRASQISAVASPQSQVITDRQFIEQEVDKLEHVYQEQPIPRPESWGGYAVKPNEFEFWQGRDNRLHDRISYRLHKNTWCKRRLAP